MDIPTPRFKIGQTVYHPRTTRQVRFLPCPDCLDTKKWKVTSGAGLEFEIACPRCEELSSSQYVPRVIEYVASEPQALTIGSIKIDTHPAHGDSPVSYMCEETGIGSGSIYYETQLCETPETARALATLAAQKFNENPEESRTQHFSREIAMWQIERVTAESERASRRRFEYACQDIWDLVKEGASRRSMGDDGLSEEICRILARTEDSRYSARATLGATEDHFAEIWKEA